MKRTELTFPSGDGRCAAWLYQASPNTRQPGESAPCIVLAHGFGGVREARLGAFAERFAEAGIAALVFDYRHFGASSGEPRQLLDIHRQLTGARRSRSRAHCQALIPTESPSGVPRSAAVMSPRSPRATCGSPRQSPKTRSSTGSPRSARWARATRSDSPAPDCATSCAEPYAGRRLRSRSLARQAASPR
jgi:hypothetical protein